MTQNHCTFDVGQGILCGQPVEHPLPEGFFDLLEPLAARCKQHNPVCLSDVGGMFELKNWFSRIIQTTEQNTRDMITLVKQHEPMIQRFYEGE